MFPLSSIVNSLVVIAALGYFVDIYDLVLFSIVRVPSLKDLGISGQALFDQGVLLLNMQMAGMLMGGILWGILGDKKGRLSVLFGSIFLYSIANIGNGFAHSVGAYAVWRFIAGLGLAGELGAGVTLVAETLPKETRGYGTMIIATVGIMGAVFAGYIAEHFHWRINYFIGGGLGLLLLLLRIGAYESGMYKQIAQADVLRGQFFSLFTNAKRFLKYLKCILIGMPIWFVIGILITFSPEFALALNLPDPISAGRAIMFSYTGLVLGDFVSGFISQYLKNRKKVVFVFMLLTTIFMSIYFMLPPVSAPLFYGVCLALGFGIGYWAVFVTIASEQFGTNLRATVTTTAPNFIRGSVVPLTFLFQFLKRHFGVIPGGAMVGALCVLIGLLALYGLEETYGKELNYVESV